MNEVNNWGCDFEDILDDSVGMGETYAEALSNADWNCTKYYVHFGENNNVRLFKVLNIEETTNDDIFDIERQLEELPGHLERLKAVKREIEEEICWLQLNNN